MSNNTWKDDFISGFLSCAQFVVIAHGQDTIAEQGLVDSGFSMAELLKAQKKSGYQTRRMNKVIREGFRRKSIK